MVQSRHHPRTWAFSGLWQRQPLAHELHSHPQIYGRVSETNRRDLERKFSDKSEIEPESTVPRELLPLTDEQLARFRSIALTPEEFALIKRKTPSGSSIRRREYVRPNPSDVKAHKRWAASTPPTSAARKAQELARWFGATC